ncbi:putative bifunctional diguanylate cyclase/phosphodiesterase [Neptuniibacter halophilus]|uniref:putative bifunctional diguanylate cyclase/phosphodiesterase n=1 Tax=Neptuniibacter halophilus TaxID=651666 RepID=UPI0025724130|nr:bifunctional diguanylate cyclase/phosphodiesterase [Neptuniibacter halophilus]
MRSISFKLIISSLFVAILTTTVYTSISLQRTIAQVNTEFEQSIAQFQASHLPSLEEAVWNFNDAQVQRIINGVTTSKYIKRIEVEAIPYFELSAGAMPSVSRAIAFPLQREKRRIATIHLYLDRSIREELIKQEILSAVYFLLIFFALQTLAIFTAVRWSVLRDLKQITSGIENISPDRLESGLQEGASQTYEIELIKEKINQLIERIKGEQTRALEYQAQLEAESNYDGLTRLPNRKNCQQFLQQRIASAVAEESVYVIYLDFINFKSINGLYGSTVGDQFLIESKRRLSSCLADNFYISRYGSDRFIVINKRPVQQQEIEQVVCLVKEELETKFRLPRSRVSFSLKLAIGVVHYPEDFTTSEQMLLASERMGKASRKAARPVYYEQSLDMEINERDQIRHSLINALPRREFSLNYQPIVDLRSGIIQGYEALIRWHSPELGFVPPDRFIEIAEDEAMIIPIEEWVIETACADMARLCTLNDCEIRLAINVCYQHFISDDFVATLQSAIRNSGLSPDQIEIELTERVLAEDAVQVEQRIQRLQRMGIKVSIDDFGTGFSALNYIKDFSFDTLKIDRSFVQSMLSNERNLALVKNIIRLAHDLDIEVIAEGIELDQQYHSLSGMNCNFGQGYLMSRPLPFRELNPKQQFANNTASE